MLTDIMLKFQIADTGEIFGDLMGFTTEMDSFPSDVRLSIGHIEIEVNEVFYDVCSRRQVIDGTITCIDDEDAREVKEEVVDRLTSANYTIYDIGAHDDADSIDVGLDDL
jgi:hypothetical protein